MKPQLVATLARLCAAHPALAVDLADQAQTPGLTPEVLEGYASERAAALAGGRAPVQAIPAPVVAGLARPGAPSAGTPVVPVAAAQPQPLKPAAAVKPAAAKPRAAEGTAEGTEEEPEPEPAAEDDEEQDPMMARMEAVEEGLKACQSGLAELRAALMGDEGEEQPAAQTGGKPAAAAKPAAKPAPKGSRPAPKGGLIGAVAGLQQSLSRLGQFAATAATDPGGAPAAVAAAQQAAAVQADDEAGLKALWSGNPRLQAACFGDFAMFRAAASADGTGVAIERLTAGRG